MRRDNNPRVYTLHVTSVDPIPSASREGPAVVLAFNGTLSRRAKEDIKHAIANGEYEIREDKKQLA